MNQQFLLTKLFIPSQKNDLIDRNKLLIKLNEIKEKKLTIISAPAGYGKSSIMTSWINNNEKVPACWYSLDEKDNDPVLFLSYLILSIQKINNKIGQYILDLLQSPQPPSIDTVLINLINETIKIPSDFIIVFDDYHMINIKQNHTIIEYLVENLPDNSHIVLITRSDPPISLGRIRAKNKLFEIRSDDLCFNKKEMNIYFNEIMQLDLTQQQINIMKKKTDGWAAGVQLAGLSLCRINDKEKFIKEFSGNNQYIIDFLVEEVLNELDDKIVSFMFKTSILDYFNIELTDFITENNNSRKIIDYLEKNNLFIIRLDNSKKNYRYHHLFKDLLFERLLSSEKVDVNFLHNRAAEWFADNNNLNESIDHYLKADNYEKAADIIEKNAWNILMKLGITTTILKWLDSLPEDIIKKRASLNLAYAWTYFIQLNIKKIAHYIETASILLQNNQTDELWGEIETIKGTLAVFTGQTDEAINLFLKAYGRKYKNDLDMKGIILLGLGYSYIVNENMEMACQKLDEAYKINYKTGFTGMALKSNGFLGYAQLIKGKFKQAFQTFEKGINLAEETHLSDLPVTTIISSGMAEYYREINELNNAFNIVKSSIDICKSGAEPLLLWNKLLSMCEIKRTMGKLTEAYDLLEKADNIISSSNMGPWKIRTHSYKIYLHLCSKKALSHSNGIDEYIKKFNHNNEWFKQAGAMMLPGLHCDFEYFVLCRSYMLLKKYDEALKVLDIISNHAYKSNRLKSSIKAKILRSIIQYLQKNTEDAVIILHEAVITAEEEGFINIFLEEGEVVKDIINQLSITASSGNLKMTNSALKYIKSLLLLTNSTSKIIKINDELMETISDREQEVIKAMSRGLSNQEISDTLYISLNTVKTHLKNINKKLSSKNRTEAISKARELGLI